MDPKQALSILSQAAAQFRGTRQDHELLEQALNALQKLVEPSVQKPESD
jgi:hypothetical protein